MPGSLEAAAQLHGALGSCRLEGSPPVSLFQLWCHHWRFHGPLVSRDLQFGSAAVDKGEHGHECPRRLDDGSSSARGPRAAQTHSRHALGGLQASRGLLSPLCVLGTRPSRSVFSGAAVSSGHERSKMLTGQRESLKHAGEAAGQRESLEQRRRSRRAESEHEAAQERPRAAPRPVSRCVVSTQRLLPTPQLAFSLLSSWLPGKRCRLCLVWESRHSRNQSGAGSLSAPHDEPCWSEHAQHRLTQRLARYLLAVIPGSELAWDRHWVFCS